MNPLAIFSLLSRLGVILKVGQVIWNLPKLYKFARNFGAIASDVFKNNRLPKNSEAQEFLYASAELLRAGIVDFPGVDEKDLAAKMEQLAIEMDAAA